MEQANLTITWESEYFSGSKTFPFEDPKRDEKVLVFLKTLKNNHDYSNRGHVFKAYKKLKITIQHS